MGTEFRVRACGCWCENEDRASAVESSLRMLGLIWFALEFVT